MFLERLLAKFTRRRAVGLRFLDPLISGGFEITFDVLSSSKIYFIKVFQKIQKSPFLILY